MKKNMILGTIAFASLMQATSPAFASNEGVGNIIGGIIGGIAGHQIGKGNGNTAATIIGAIAGTVIGGQIGHDMDENDRRAWEQAHNDCLNQSVGQSSSWQGDRGNRGTITTTREGYNAQGAYCREYRSEVFMRDGRRQVDSGYSCRDARGSWSEQSSVVFVDRGGPRGPVAPAPIRPVRPVPVRPPMPAPVPPPPPSRVESVSSLVVSAVTRQGGGQWYRVAFADGRAAVISKIRITVLKARVKLHQAAILSGNQRFDVSEFSETPVFGTNESREANYNLRSYGAVSGVDILAESFGDYADILVEITTPDGQQQLQLTRF
jgi:surface antigen